jgi:hypothetical protein
MDRSCSDKSIDLLRQEIAPFFELEPAARDGITHDKLPPELISIAAHFHVGMGFVHRVIFNCAILF